MSNQAFLLPDETLRFELEEDREVRALMEAMGITGLAAALLILRIITLPHNPSPLTPFDAILMGGAVAISALRGRRRYRLTSHRIVQIDSAGAGWVLRYDQITGIRRMGSSLYLKGRGKATYAIVNLKEARWLEDYLREQSPL